MSASPSKISFTEFSVDFCPSLNKCGVINRDSKIILGYDYDTIHIVDDHYAILGIYHTSIDRNGTTDELLYGLYDLKSGIKIFDTVYEFLYIKDGKIYILPSIYECGYIRGVNKVTCLKQYSWRFKEGERFFDYPIVAGNEEYAILAIRQDKESEYLWEFRLVDSQGKTILSELAKYGDGSFISTQDRVSDNLLNFIRYDIPVTEAEQFVNLDDLNGYRVHSTWKSFSGKINYKSIPDRKFEFLIELPNGSKIICNWYEILGNHFMVCHSKQLRSNHIGHSTVINAKGEVIFSADSVCNFDQLIHGWKDRLIINEEIIMDTNGNLFKSPHIKGQHCLMPDYCGYTKYYKNGYFGIADKNGNIISPCIFPIPDVHTSLPDWRDNDYDSDDAYDGLSDARWNTD